MTIGTCHLAQVARSASSRSFDLWTIWLTANGAAGRSGWSRLCAASSSVIRCSHSSSSACGRALSAGNEPTIPALHCAITSSGPEMMNSGEPMTGRRRRSKRAGRVMDRFHSATECAVQRASVRLATRQAWHGCVDRPSAGGVRSLESVHESSPSPPCCSPPRRPRSRRASCRATSCRSATTSASSPTRQAMTFTGSETVDGRRARADAHDHAQRRRPEHHARDVRRQRGAGEAGRGRADS